jgi:hypothetical protein
MLNLFLLRDTSVALETGEFERAEALLNQARDRDLEAAKKLAEVGQMRLLSAATSTAANGKLKYAQLAYAEAAKYYREAANILPLGAEEVLVVYLRRIKKISFTLQQRLVKTGGRLIKHDPVTTGCSWWRVI